VAAEAFREFFSNTLFPFSTAPTPHPAPYSTPQKGLDDGKRNELPSFVASLVHHLVVAPVGLHLFFKDWARVPAEYLTMDYALSFGGLWSVPFAFGYMAADSIIFTFPQLLKGHYEYAMHHGAALTLFYGFVSTSGAVVRFMPAIYLCECSGVIFATAWFVRNGGGRDTAFLKFLELSFAVVFFITRIINFPLSMYTLMNLPTTMDSVGIIRFALFPLIVLQFYWFYMIIKTLEKKKKTAAAARDEKKA